jgi:glutaredoxin
MKIKIICPHCKKEINKNNIGNYSDSVLYGMNCVFCHKYFGYFTKINIEVATFKTDKELQENWEIYIEKYRSTK